MANDDRIKRLESHDGGRVRFEDLIARIENHMATGGNSGGGGGDTRIAKVEATVDHINRDILELRTDMKDARDRLIKIEERVTHLPSKGFVVNSLLAALAVIAGLITFQQHLVSLTGQQNTPFVMETE